jgi:hypothetical protein
LGEAVTDGLEEMRLAEAHAAVDEEGVVRLGRGFGDRQASRLRELVRRADDEGLKAVSRIEVRRRRRGGRRRYGRQRGRPVDRENELGPRPDNGGDGGPKGLEISLLEVLAEKLIRDNEFHPCFAGVQYPQGADPRLQDLGGKLPLQGVKKLLVKVVAHREAFLRDGVTHTLIHGGG